MTSVGQPRVGVAFAAAVASALVATTAAHAESLAARAARFPPVREARAAFEQEREVSLVADVLRARGTLTLRAPDAMRLELTEPESLALVAEGSRITVLDAAGAPVPLPAEATGLADFARELTSLLLAGDTGGRFDEHWDGATSVRLVPRAPTAPFAEIVLRFTSAGPLPDEIVLRERAGDRTTIRLRGIRVTNGEAHGGGARS